MIVTDFTRRALAIRREDRAMQSAGYRKHETDWEIHRGGLYREHIVDARISCDGKYVWTKLSKLPTDPSMHVGNRVCPSCKKQLDQWNSHDLANCRHQQAKRSAEYASHNSL